MSRDDKLHLDVFFQCSGERYPIGHGDIPESQDLVSQAGAIATLLHTLAWEYEEKAKNQVEQDEAADRPRKVRTKAGDLFFEVAPDAFVAGMSFDDAVETYEMFDGSGTSTFDQLKTAFPGIQWEYV